MEPIRFDPTRRRYKAPFGAVRATEPFTIHIEVEQSLRADFVHLVLRRDGQAEFTRHRLEKQAGGDGYDRFSGNTQISEAGLHFYRFEVVCGEVYHFAGKDTAGRCAMGDWLEEWLLTVYDQDFATPGWLAGAVMYQIFPDRFARGDGHREMPPAKNQRTVHAHWLERPEFIYDRPDYEGTDFFGGTLRGITEKLDYIASLGVNVLYLNPVFEAAANHRYNTGDYLKIDPYLGTNEDFTQLCREAGKRGMRLLLDGVFSHTGADSIYFNRFGHYDTCGAYQSADSPYAKWYSFGKSRDTYDCWWGFKTLPNVNETEPSYLAYICDSENGVLPYWLRQGAGGWRLDVVDELPDAFLDALRASVKSADPDAFILGEVWENAVTKQSYGIHRRYLLGKQLDGVMNYPFRQAVIDVVKSGDTARFAAEVTALLEAYPRCTWRGLMNMLSTHDTLRILNAFGVEREVAARAQGDYRPDAEEYARGKERLLLASVLQYFLPGIPSVYYGDEVGLDGFADPWNRRCFPWDGEDAQLLAHFRALGKLRSENRILFDGEFTLSCPAPGQLLLTFSEAGDALAAAVNLSDQPFDLSAAQLLRGEPIYAVGFADTAGPGAGSAAVYRVVPPSEN